MIKGEIRFRNKNENNWKRLEEYNMRFLKGFKLTTKQEIREFAKLFRLVSYHLTYAAANFPNSETYAYLNRLVGVSHNHFYVRESSTLLDIKYYLLYGFPKAVRDSWRYWVLAMGLFVLGLLFAGLYVGLEPERVGEILPVEMFGNVSDIELTGEVEWDYPLMSAVIMTNNIAVSINAIGLGILAGLGTVYILVYNGMIIGGLFGYFHQAGMDMLIAYSLVLPHGVIELSAIFLSGGAGLMLGKGLLIPGKYKRTHSIIIHAKKAAMLIPGIVLMLIIGGLIEGFFTPLPIAPEIKLGFAALTGIGFYAYILWKRYEPYKP